MPDTPRPFTLTVSDSAISDLQARLDLTRFPDQTPGEPWAFGTDLAFMKRLVGHWGRGFDWRAAEARLNAFPQFTVPVDGIDLHFIHVEGKGPNPLPLMLVHGWPRIGASSAPGRPSTEPRHCFEQRRPGAVWPPGHRRRTR